jgi:hypothetical protein
MEKVSWIVTETVNNREVEVWEVYKKADACRIISNYTGKDRDNLLPCMYKKVVDGEFVEVHTTEF